MIASVVVEASPPSLIATLIPVIVAVLMSGTLIGAIKLWIERSDRQVDRDGKSVETAGSVIEFLERQLKQERERHEEVVRSLSDRVAVLESRLEAAEERSERYAGLLWQARHTLGKKEAELGEALRDLAELGDARRHRKPD